MAGFAEEGHINDFQFELQRRTFHSYGNVDHSSIKRQNIDSIIGYANDPSATGSFEEGKLIGETEKAQESKGCLIANFLVTTTMSLASIIVNDAGIFLLCTK